jgi:predicted GNAT family acetyltransferase
MLAVELDIEIDQNEQKFYVLISDQECFLNYRTISDNIVEYYRTFVPLSLRNKGIAAKLVKFALNHARENNQKIIPSCPYIASYVDHHPQWQSIIAS